MTRPGSQIVALGVGSAALVVWAVLAILAPAPALQGWLIGFVFVSSLSLGSLAAVLIHRLVGGRWGEAFAAELRPAARATPLLLLFVIPILAGLPLIYAWAAAPGAVDPQVRALFLNPPLFILRSAIALIGWSVIALLLPRIEGPRGRLGAGLALAFYGIAVSVVGVDWVLSTLPSWTSSDFGMDFAAQQLAAAFALAALQGRRGVDDAAAGDICGLMFATIIGLTYLEFVSYLVVWYGDKPKLDAWYIVRAAAPWRVLMWASLAFGALGVVILAGRRRFSSHRAAALAGGCVLAALISYQLWLLAPGFGAGCLAPAAAALIGQAGIWLAVAGGAPRAARKLGGVAHAG